MLLFYVLAFMVEIFLAVISFFLVGVVPASQGYQGFSHSTAISVYYVVYTIFILITIFCSFRALRSIIILEEFKEKQLASFFAWIEQKGDSTYFLKGRKKLINICLAYKDTFIKNSDEGYCKTRSNADLYFGPTAWIVDTHTTPLLGYLKIIPATFIGVGILGTFIGFADGVSSLRLDTTENLLSSVNGLIEGLNTAFNTSIVGVLGSIFMNFCIVNPILNRVDKVSKELCDKIDKEFFVTEVEALSVIDEQGNSVSFSLVMRSVIDKLQDVSVNIKQMSTDIGKNLVEGISDSFDTLIADVMNKQIDTLAQKLEDSVSGLDKAGGIFQILPQQIKESTENFAIVCKEISNMQSNFTKSIADVDNTLKNMQDSTANIVASISGVAKEFGDSATESREVIEESIDKAIEFQDKIATVSTNIFEQSTTLQANLEKINAAAVEKNNDVVGKLKDLYVNILPSIQATMDGLAKSTNTVATTSKAFQDAVSAFSDLDAGISHLFDSMKNGVGEYSGLMKKSFSDMQSNFTKSIADVDNTLKNMQDSTANMVASISGSAQKFDDSVTESREVIEKSIDKAIEFQDKIATVSANIFKQCVTLQEDLKKINKSVVEKNNDFVGKLTDLHANLLPSIQSTVDGLTKSNKVVMTTSNAFQDTVSAFGDLDAGISHLFDSIKTGIEEYSNLMEKNLSDKIETFDTKITHSFSTIDDSVQDISSSIAKSSDMVNNLNKTTEQLTSSVASINSAMANITELNKGIASIQKAAASLDKSATLMNRTMTSLGSLIGIANDIDKEQKQEGRK